ncbi:hypothetical protein P0082_02165 [Candidatus Haliotispira prima]|uniref:Fibronectin type-III domain-containing protein n=1 Tax=Candidatus Haliotispira prima TaxID=3034016 RepID=A0ABY8MID7_9SPIO|nr:hypothetical protein P0082_02165 [Candidatus Haliotispira prima]
MEYHEFKNIHSANITAGKTPAKRTPIRKSIRMKNGKTRIIMAVLALLSIFVLSCEESSGKGTKVERSYLLVEKSPTLEADGRYMFEISSFVSADAVLYDKNTKDISKEKLNTLWVMAGVRWGFRRKDSPDRIYWMQKNRGYTKADGNEYTVLVDDTEKAKFRPATLPAALLQEPESNIEVYAMISIEDTEVSGVYDLPANFKFDVMKGTEISGQVLQAAAGSSARAKIVPGAGVYYIHKGSGKIFHTFSDVSGEYRISVQDYGTFSKVVLSPGTAPYVAAYTLAKVPGRVVVTGEDFRVNTLTTGVAVASSQLYDITAGTLAGPTGGGVRLAGSTIEQVSTKVIPGAFLLFYDKVSSSIYFLKSGLDGRFQFRLPVGTLTFIPAAYGYISIHGYVAFDSENNSPAKVLESVNFKQNPAIQISDMDRDGLSATLDADDGNWDTDGDGIPDGADADVNGDGRPDNGIDSDNDGINDKSDATGSDPDKDLDRIKDAEDTIDNRRDADKDGLPDDIDPNDNNADTDGDGIPDGADVDVNGDGKKDNGADQDNDGINDLADVDKDGNGYPDPGKRDSDSDGLDDTTDPVDNSIDTDKDGLPDTIDPDSKNWDTDGDGIPDGADVDVDGDGTRDNGSDTDRDGINDRSDLNQNPGKTDSDGDNIIDDVDLINNRQDSDNDGLPDAIDPNNSNPDTDNDGIKDGADVDVNGDGTNDNGKDADGDGTNNANDPINNRSDRDRDGLDDAQDPNDNNWDTDGDGIPDGADVDVNGDGTNDNGTDTDGDGINDRLDADQNPGKTDADGNGMIDALEVVQSSEDADKDGFPDAQDPNDNNWDTDGDGIPDGVDVDVNGDGTNDNGTDTDGDGINDKGDINSHPGQSDSDNDGIVDAADKINQLADADNDSLPDRIDPQSKNWDTDGDNIPDGADVDVNGDGTPDNGRDTDGDGINDRSDRDIHPGKSDIDNDNIIDEMDKINNNLDSDSDGLPDAVDPNDFNVDTDNDTIKDGDDADVNGDRILDNGTDVDGDGFRDNSPGAGRPKLSWNSRGTAATQDADGSLIDFDGNANVYVTLQIEARSTIGGSFTYKWYVGTTLSNVAFDSTQSGPTARFALNSAGANVVLAKVSNSAGESSLSRTYILNRPPSNLRVTSPSPGVSIDISSGTGVALEAAATDADGHGLSYSWMIALGSGVTNAAAFNPISVDAFGTYIFTQAAGNYTIRARASDGNGGSTEGQTNITLTGDASAFASRTRPGIAILGSSTNAAPLNNPLRGDGSAASSGLVTVNGLITENGGAAIRSVRWLVDGVTQTGTTAFSSGQFSYGQTFNISNPANVHTVTMVAVNTLGEEGRQSRSFYLNRAPVFDESATASGVSSYIVPSAKNPTVATPQRINVKAADVNGGTLTYTAAFASGFNVPATGAYTALAGSNTASAGTAVSMLLSFGLGVSSGDYTLRIIARDTHGGAQGVLLRNVKLQSNGGPVISSVTSDKYRVVALNGLPGGETVTLTANMAETGIAPVTYKWEIETKQQAPFALWQDVASLDSGKTLFQGNTATFDNDWAKFSFSSVPGGYPWAFRVTVTDSTGASVSKELAQDLLVDTLPRLPTPVVGLHPDSRTNAGDPAALASTRDSVTVLIDAGLTIMAHTSTDSYLVVLYSTGPIADNTYVPPMSSSPGVQWTWFPKRQWGNMGVPQQRIGGSRLHTGLTVPNLQPGTLYYFRVIAYPHDPAEGIPPLNQNVEHFRSELGPEVSFRTQP